MKTKRIAVAAVAHVARGRRVWQSTARRVGAATGGTAPAAARLTRSSNGEIKCEQQYKGKSVSRLLARA